MDDAVILAVIACTGFWELLKVVAVAVIDALKGKRKVDMAQTQDDVKALKAANLSMLYDRLYELCMRALRVGEITAEDRQNIHQLLKPYEQLGGDGLIHDLCERVDELPLFVDSE